MEDLYKYAEYLPQLAEREAAVLRLRYGDDLCAMDGKTGKQTAEHFGVTRERIRQIEAKAIRKLERYGAMKLMRDLRAQQPPGRRRTCASCGHYAHAHYRISMSCAAKRKDMPLQAVLDEVGTLYGACHRYPLTGNPPYTYHGSWCGEWSPAQCDDVTPIDSLDWSVRARHAFRRHGIATVAQLANTSKRTMMEWKNVGAKTILEIEQRLAALGHVTRG